MYKLHETDGAQHSMQNTALLFPCFIHSHWEKNVNTAEIVNRLRGQHQLLILMPAKYIRQDKRGTTEGIEGNYSPWVWSLVR